MNPNQRPTHPLPEGIAINQPNDPMLPVGSHQVVVIRRHPFGLVALFFQTFIGLGISFGLIFFLLPGAMSTIDPNSSLDVTGALSILAVIVVALAALFMLLAAWLYRQNRWVVSDDSITQVLRVGLFRFHTSGLSMANIEDVVSEKTGIFATIFNFGTLRAETAGEQSIFQFQYCPKPDMYAKILLDTRERFIEHEPAQAHRANERLNLPPQQ